ncbi:hypothetical protein G6F35_007060 [Rhizopus arrhizus]|nr:hypothetical protein G6F35_007060 [Rhizopus arrhizus]
MSVSSVKLLNKELMVVSPPDTDVSNFGSTNWDSSSPVAGWGGSGDNNAVVATPVAPSSEWGEPAAHASNSGW